MDNTFWGCIVEPGKAAVFVPPPEEARLHISQVNKLNEPLWQAAMVLFCYLPKSKVWSRTSLGALCRAALLSPSRNSTEILIVQSFCF